jgi:peptide/nickel transport system permease protein
MTGYALRRLGTAIMILVVISLLVFLATHALPSDTAALILGQYSTPETLAALEHKLDLDLPLQVQYWRWAGAPLQGDMGQSLVMERPIAPILWDAFGRSAILAVAAMAIVATGASEWASWRRSGADAGRIMPSQCSPISVFRCRSSTGAWC